MAASFGFKQEHCEVSRTIAEVLREGLSEKPG
jgi:hypothetical protein